MYNSLFWSISPQDAVTQGGFLVDIVNDDILHGYEGGGSGQSHPENADPDQRVDKHGWS
eukprot:COSAG05_NODE_3227_length_2224_cov_9.071459_1_plen_59_part_00